MSRVEVEVVVTGGWCMRLRACEASALQKLCDQNPRKKRRAQEVGVPVAEAEYASMQVA